MRNLGTSCQALVLRYFTGGIVHGWPGDRSSSAISPVAKLWLFGNTNRFSKQTSILKRRGAIGDSVGAHMAAMLSLDRTTAKHIRTG